MYGSNPYMYGSNSTDMNNHTIVEREREDLEQLRVVGTRFGAASAREGEDLEELHVVGTRVRSASTREEANAGGTSGRPLSTPLPGRDRREVAHHHRGAGRRRRGFAT
jgi:hypothetical protein